MRVYERDLQTIDQLRKISLAPLDWHAGALEGVAQDLCAIPKGIRAKLTDIQEQVAQLEQAGVTRASTSWRKDSAGDPTILYLICSGRNGKRRQEYVGKDPARQAKALAQLERWEQRQHLLRQANHLLWQANRLTDHLGRLQRDIHVALESAADLRRQTGEYIEDNVRPITERRGAAKDEEIQCR